MLDLARDLAHGKDMSLLFSSHLLPDVEFVCDHVLVLAKGRLVAHGQIQELKDLHDQCYEVRVKNDAESFARRLDESGCTVKSQDHGLLVHLPAGRSQQMLWELAAAAGEQIRHLAPSEARSKKCF